MKKRQLYAGGIWKRKFHSETHQMFSAHTIWTSDVNIFKRPAFNMFYVHFKTQSQRYEIPPVWLAFPKSSIFATDWCEP